ncbi:telomere-protecting terminal protein Tpg [Kitasatospora sp. NPDC089913]|uniref:telomere-protecting terminal protein Tpg n=1 Tax=Kitasatospora sp. NPDC089913 TaxID=3364080 RepID=UPI0038099802
MGEIDEGLERAERTRPISQSVPARMRFPLKGANGSTKALAADLGVSQRTVQRWLKGQGPEPAAANAVEAKVRAAWQPWVKQRVRRDAEKNGFTLHICGSFGFKSGPKSTDNPRDGRVLRQKMPGEVARRLFAARDAGAGQAE